MPIQIVRQDITRMQVDAIVNAANETLLGGGGVDGCIHRAAGPQLLEECRTLNGCRTGDAKLTKGYRLPAKYVIHTVGPIWQGGGRGEPELLRSCYRRSLEIADQAGCESIAFPLISSGVYGYPKDQAFRMAMDTITAFLVDHEMTVYIVVFDKQAVSIGSRLMDVQAYIDDVYVETREEREKRSRRVDPRIDSRTPRSIGSHPKQPKQVKEEQTCYGSVPGTPFFEAADQSLDASLSLEELMKQVDESFSEMLLRKIDESGMKDSECYKKANVDRKLFSKIRKDPHYKPSKPTVLAFAVALELSLEETRDMLMKAGFALSHSSKFDIIVEYFIVRGIYDVFAINETLFDLDQSTLGTM